MAETMPKASFSSLPAEIRIKIFRCILSSDQDINPKVSVKGRLEKHFPGRFLRINKLFNVEAAAVLYSENKHVFLTMYECLIFLQRIGKTNRSHVKSVYIAKYLLTNKEAQALGLACKSAYDTGLEDASDYISESCPNLTYIAIAGVNRNRLDDNLKKFRSFIRKFPQLSNVYHSDWAEAFILNVIPLSDSCKAFPTRCYGSSWGKCYHNFKAFDVDQLIQKVEDKKELVDKLAQRIADNQLVLNSAKAKKAALAQEMKTLLATD